MRLNLVHGATAIEPTCPTPAVVLGGGGFLGLNVVHALERAGRGVRATYRGRAPRIALRRTSATTVHADLDAPDGLVAALEGTPTVFF